MGRGKCQPLKYQVSVKTCTTVPTCIFLCGEDPSYLHHSPSLMEIPPNRCLQRFILWPLQPGGRLRCWQCQCEDIGGGSWGLELGSSPPPRQMCSGLKMMKWRYWRYEGHNDLLQGKGYFLRKKMSWIVFCAGLLCKRKAWLPHKTHSQVWGENQHKTQTDKQEQMRWGMLLLWEWVTHTTDSWCSSNWTTFFYSQAGY